MKKQDKKELIRILQDCKVCVKMVRTDWKKEETLLLYCGGLLQDIDVFIKNLGGK